MDKLASKEVVDHILKHHGVLGMKWGRRRSREELASVSVKERSNPQVKTTIRTKGGKGLPAHPDAIAAKVITQKLKKSGTHALSNKELQDLATRTNLEAQIHRSGVGESTLAKGSKHVSTFLKTPEGQQAVASATKLATSDSGKKLVKHLVKGVKIASVMA